MNEVLAELIKKHTKNGVLAIGLAEIAKAARCSEEIVTIGLKEQRFEKDPLTNIWKIRNASRFEGMDFGRNNETLVRGRRK